MHRNSGHKRAHSYFSGFTLATAQSDLPILTSRAQSTERLVQVEVSTRALYSTTKRSSSCERLEANKLQIEEELEQLTNTKYSEVTVPAIKYAVCREKANMARPNTDTEMLDQTLLSIRERLVSNTAAAIDATL